MIVNKWKSIKFEYHCACMVDEKELKKAIKWYSNKPVTRLKTIFLYGQYPAISIYDTKIHIHRLLMMYWLKRDLERNEYVHHIYNNKFDCTRQCLNLQNANKHQSLHNKGKILSQSHKNKIRKANKKRKGMKYKIYENEDLLK